jgi:NAD(P)-dependent dehydrogenase (short-subunit alcohol dehydrogenase family)
MSNTVLITGAGRGIGLEFARQYAEDGWQVHAGARSPENAPGLLRLAAEHRGRVQVHPLDVTDSRHIVALAAAMAGTPLDLLVNNAGVYGGDRQGFGQTDEKVWLDCLRTNVIAPMKLMESFAGHLAAAQRPVIANLSSKMGSMADNGSGGAYVYRSSKAALNAVVVSAAIDLAPRRIIAVALHPGWVQTEMGGPQAEIPARESVARMRAILAGLGPADAGRFIDIDGSDIPW